MNMSRFEDIIKLTRNAFLREDVVPGRKSTTAKLSKFPFTVSLVEKELWPSLAKQLACYLSEEKKFLRKDQQH